MNHQLQTTKKIATRHDSVNKSGNRHKYSQKVLCCVPSHIRNVSRTSNFHFSLSSMKCAVMLRYESTALDVQQSVVSTRNMAYCIQDLPDCRYAYTFWE